MVGDVRQEVESELFLNFATIRRCQPAQVGRVPSVRFNLFFEKPLHALGVFGRAIPTENTADFRGDAGRSGFRTHVGEWNSLIADFRFQIAVTTNLQSNLCNLKCRDSGHATPDYARHSKSVLRVCIKARRSGVPFGAAQLRFGTAVSRALIQPGRASNSQPLAKFFNRYSPHADDFVPAAMSGDYRDGRAW